MIKLSFLGDVSLNDAYGELARQNINPFKDLHSHLFGSDFVTANLEAVCGSDNSENNLKTTRLKIKPVALTFLKNLNIGLVTLANNHVYDNLYDGFKKTVDFLQNNEINYVGAWPKEVISDKYVIKEIKNKKIAFLNYVHPDTNPKLPENASIDLNLYDSDTIVEQIKNARSKADYVCLILHWGMDESAFPMSWQRRDARLFVKAGTDCIIGHHSHVLQGFELIDNKPVFYSLGNFCFAPFELRGDLYEINYKRHGNSVIADLLLDENLNAKIEIIPIQTNKLDVKIGSKKTLAKIKRLSTLMPYIEKLWPIYKLYLSIFYKLYFYFFGNNRNPIDRLKKIDKRRVKRLFEIIKLR